MTKEEIKQYVENDIEYHCGEFDLPREVAIEPVMINIVYRYKIGKLSREDLTACADYLGYTLNVDLIDQQIEQEKIDRLKRREQRRKRRLFIRVTNDVLAHTKIEDVAKKICEVVDEIDGIIYAKCPWCKDKGSLAIYKDKQAYKCFNCGKEGNALNLVEKVYGMKKKLCPIILGDLIGYTSQEFEALKKEVLKEIK